MCWARINSKYCGWLWEVFTDRGHTAVLEGNEGMSQADTCLKNLLNIQLKYHMKNWIYGSEFQLEVRVEGIDL